MFRYCRLATLITLLGVIFAASPATAQSLSPDLCDANSVLPTTYTAWQEQSRWMGVAVGPQNPTQSVYLEMLEGDNIASALPYDPPVVSELATATNFLVKNFGGLPSEWIYPKAYKVPAGNLAHVIDWTQGFGGLGQDVDQTMAYGGLAYGCGMIQVYSVFLEAGQEYRFWLTSDNPLDDVKMALLGTGSGSDGWVARSEAFFEKAADPDGAGAPRSFIPAQTANYALVVFVDDLTAAGGNHTVRYEEYTPPVNEPDLVVTSIGPPLVAYGYSFTAEVTIENRGGAASEACFTRVQRGSVEMCVNAPTPAIPAGGTAITTCEILLLAPGPVSITAEVDYGDYIDESDETNNELTTTVYVVASATPNLVVSFVQPQEVVPGLATEVTVTISNTGEIGAGASTTRFEVDGGATSIDIPTPSVSGAWPAKIMFTLPGQAEGPHLVTVTADVYDDVAEADELDNDYSFVLEAEAPNLVVTEITPTEVYGATAPTFRAVVENVGTVDAPSSVAELKINGVVAAEAEMSGINAGFHGVVLLESSFGLATPGTYSVQVCADAEHHVPESDEGDNCLAVGVEMVPSSVAVAADGSGQYPTIQAAVDAVADGGEVLVWPGVYQGDGNRDINFGGKDIVVVGIGDGEVVIDCQGDPETARRGFRFDSGETNTATLRNVTIINGWQEYGSGGGILISGAAPTIEDVIIRDCWADNGGAMAFGGDPAGGARPQVVGCTLVGNHALDNGAALYMYGDIGVEVANTLIASNFGFGGAVGYAPAGTFTITLSCCDVWGHSSGDYTGPIAGQLGLDNNISANPLFCDAAADDYYLASNSSCAEANNAACGLIGALEAACGPMGGTVRSVNASGTGDYVTIQQAINNAVDGDIVELADGTYTGPGNTDLSTLGKEIIVRSSSDNPAACRIDCQDTYRAFFLDDGEGPTTVIRGIGILNGAAATGAGIGLVGSSPSLENLRLDDCNATGDGGALHCESSSSPRLIGCFFDNNTAGDDGGAIYAHDFSSPIVTACNFVGNLAAARGGGALFVVNSFPEVTGCVFQGNESADGGGVAFVYAYGPVTTSLFVDNTATDRGGAVYGYGNAQATFTGCTMHANTAPNGASVYVRNNSSPTFTNCLLTDGLSGTAFDRYGTDSNPTLECTDIHGHAFGDWTAMISAQLGTAGNIWADPLYCNAAIGNLRLRGDSPCAMANNAACGQIGALPVGCSGSWLVRPDGTGDFATIQEAIDAAAPAETVVLADGTFAGPGNRDLDFLGKAITVRSQSGDATTCVIDCEGSAGEPHRGVSFITGESVSTVLENVTITGGWMTTGAGGRIHGASPTLRGVVFRDCGGSDGGGLIVGGGSTAQLEDCVFADNVADDAGGGVYVNTSYPQFIRCTFEGNAAHWGGGGLYCQYAAPNLLECVFEGNTSNHWGGALHARYIESGVNATRCVFRENSAPQGGAVHTRNEAYPSFTECTFVGNASASGAAFYLRTDSNVNVIRSILALSPEGAAVADDGTGTANLYCCDVYGNAGGDWTGLLAGQYGVENNFSADPVFCDYYADNLTLASVSPCLPSRSPCGWQVGAFGEGCAVSTVPDAEVTVPARLVMEQNVPNPFNPMTRLRFATPRAGMVEVLVYGLDGRRIALVHRGVLVAGPHEVLWQARSDSGEPVASGVYLAQVRFGGEVKSRKIMLVR